MTRKKKNKHLGTKYEPIIFDVGQIYYSVPLDFLFLVTDVDRELNRAKLLYEVAEFFPSSWFKDLAYIGEL